jgi:hypothetical protein
MSPQQALEWLEQHDKPEAIEKYFSADITDA